MMGKVVTIMVSFASLSAGAIVTHGLNLWLQKRAFAAHVPVFLLPRRRCAVLWRPGRHPVPIVCSPCSVRVWLALKSDDVIAQIERELVDDD